MKIISLQKNFKDGLYAVSHIAQKNSSLPVLNNVLISARDGGLKLITTNLEIGITSTLRGKIEEEGAFTVDARIISEYVALLDNDKVTLTLNDSNLLVECGNYSTKIKGLSAEEFPLIPAIGREGGIIIPTDALKQALSQVVFAVSSDEGRAELSGVLCIFEKGEMIIAGTDSYRLAEKHIPVTGDFAERQLIIPARTLQELARILGATRDDEGDDGKNVILFASENQCLFVIGGTEIVSRLIEGRYPDYRQIIPAKHSCRAIVAKDEVTRAIKAASIFSRAGINDVLFSFSKNTITVSSASGQTGEHSSKVLANTEGEDASITLNFRYVIDGLQAMIGDEIVFEVVDDQTPCIIKDKKDDLYTYLVMPIKK